MDVTPRADTRIATFGAIESAVLIAAMLIAMGLGAVMLKHQDRIGCFEACDIATAISTGHGFTIDQRWLFEPYVGDDQEPLRYYPTAWVDPVYTYVLAAVISSSGSFSRYVAGWLNPLLFVAVVALTFRLASRIEGVSAGLLSATLIAWLMCSRRWDWVIQLNNTLSATVFVLLFAMALHRAVAAPSVKSAAVLGLAAGITILACPAAIGFLPVALLATFLANWRRWRLTAISVSVTLCIAMAVLTPWAVRNYLTFGEFVPVRTGSGAIVFEGVVATGATVDPGTLKNAASPPWRARDPQEAVTKSRQDHERSALETFQVRYARMVAGDEFDGMNEAQRDKWFNKETRDYILEHPKLSMDLAIWKMSAFGSIMGPLGALLLALATFGSLVAVIRRRLDLLVLVVCILVFAAPFVLITPYFMRYRLPIEPIVVIAAVITIREFGRFLGFGSRFQEVRTGGRRQPITTGSESVRAGIEGPKAVAN